MIKIPLFTLLLASASLFACGDDEPSDNTPDGAIIDMPDSATGNTPDAMPSAIEIAGTWDTNFSTTEMISSSAWGAAAIISFDNEMNYAISQNPSNAEFSPDAFNKLVWTEINNNSFYYCTVDFGLDTLEAAQNSIKMADSTDPDNAGCGGFSWTKMTLAGQ